MNMVICMHMYEFFVHCTGVEIDTGPVAHGQWICCRASKICYPLARLAYKILKTQLLRLHGLMLI